MDASKATAIVPAHNEEATVGDVVRALKSCRRISRVIVVDDGSTDRTSVQAEAAGADRVVKAAIRGGKAEALRLGVQASDGAEILFFCDADFIGFTPQHAEALIAPVCDGRVMMRTGLRDRAAWLIPFLRHLPLLSGERALRREVFERVPERFLKGFRAEIAMNYACRANGLAYDSLVTRGVRFVRKMQKAGILKGFLGYCVMAFEIADAMIRVRLARRDFVRRPAPLPYAT